MIISSRLILLAVVLQVLIHENYMTRGEYVFTQSILQLCSVQFDSIGNYSCVANNEVGTSSEIIQLIVISAHGITITIVMHK